MLVGIVGKANVGKSTFFKAATLADTLIANYPFATIKPNSGVGYVKVDCADAFFNTTCNPREGFCKNHKRFVPIELIDVAGLVPGAHEGKGMGNQFLDDLRQADVLIHVVDIAGTTNEKGEPVQKGGYDPANDIKFLAQELDFWILRLLKKGWDKFSRSVQQTHKQRAPALAAHLSGLGITEDHIALVIEKLSLDKKPIIDWTEDDLMSISSKVRQISKPMIIACNKIDMPGAIENYERVKKEFPDIPMVQCSAESELALKEAAKHNLIEYIPGEGDFKVLNKTSLSEKQAQALEFIHKNVLLRFDTTGVQNILDTSVLNILGYMPIFPGGLNNLKDQNGNILPDCFLLKDGSTALDFAYRLHTDFGKNFIRAIDVKTKRTVGKDHLLKPGDVVEIVADR